MKARHYDPVIGRFYSNDPVGFKASNPMMFNRYAYANNNPYAYTDPDGRQATFMDLELGPSSRKPIRHQNIPVVSLSPNLQDAILGAGLIGIGLLIMNNEDGSDSSGVEEVDGGLEGEAQYDSSTDPKLEAGPPTEKQLKKFQKQLDEHGLSSLEDSRDSIQKNLDEHLANLEEYRSAGGYTSSVEREIRNFKRELEAIDNVLENSD